MKKSLFVVFFTVCLCVTNSSYAKKNPSPVPAKSIQNIDFEKLNFTKSMKSGEEYNKLLQFIQKYDHVANQHNADELKKLYASNYVNADGLTSEELISLIKKTWENFPDLKFTSSIESVHINNNYATVQTFDIAKGITAQLSEMTKDTGEMTSNSRVIIYLQKHGSEWKILSDKVLYEKTFLKYGKGKEIKVDFSAPEQVYSGDEYTASIYTEMPAGIVALGSITREPIVFPEASSDEVFRQIPNEAGVLERVMKANQTNNNELAVSSVGYTELVQDLYQNPQIKLTGMVLMMQRVNVVPKSCFVPTQKTNVQQATAKRK